MSNILKTITIPALKGDLTITEASDVFTGYIDSYFKNWKTDVPSKKTSEAKMSIFDLTENKTFAQIFIDPKKMCMTQAQIIYFVKNHKDLLRTDGYGTFFLFKVGNKFFVACVCFRDVGQLGVDVYRFSLDVVWDAGYRRRIVVPQLALESSETELLTPSYSDLLTLERIEQKLDLLLKHFNN